MVLVPVTLPSLSPWASRPNSLADDVFQILLCFGLRIVEILAGVVVTDELYDFTLFLLSELHVGSMWYSCSAVRFISQCAP